MARFQLRAPLCPGVYGHIYSYFHLRAESSSNPFSQIGSILLPPVVHPLLLNLQAHSGPRPPKTWAKRLILFARCHKKCYILFAFVYIYIYIHTLTSVLLKIHKGESVRLQDLQLSSILQASITFTLSPSSILSKSQHPHTYHSSLRDTFCVVQFLHPVTTGFLLLRGLPLPDQPVLPRVLVNQILFPYQRLRKKNGHSFLFFLEGLKVVQLPVKEQFLFFGLVSQFVFALTLEMPMLPRRWC